jgi:hypothetical protein
VPSGLAIAATLTGLYFFLLDRVGGSGMSGSAWLDLFFAAIVAVATTAAVGWLVERSNEETRRLSRLSASGDAWEPIPAAGSAPATAEPSAFEPEGEQEPVAAAAAPVEAAPIDAAAFAPEPAQGGAAAEPEKAAVAEPAADEPEPAPGTAEATPAEAAPVEPQAAAPKQSKRRSKKAEA